MWVEFDGILNVRDLGGVQTADGRRVKPRRLLRGARLDEASDADLRRLREDYDLRQIVDFRDGSEVARRPDRPVAGAVYGNYPALPYLPGKAAAPQEEAQPDFDENFRRLYRQLALDDAAAAAYRAFFDILLAQEQGAVFFHCTQGKDRTGVAALLLLAALGAPRETALEGYFLSNEGLRSEFEKPLSGPGALWPREVKEKLFFVQPEIIAQFFAQLDAAYGGELGYLKTRLGLTQADLETLRRRYLE